MTRSEAPPHPSRDLRFSLVVLCLAAVAAILYRFPPTAYAVYPQCPVWLLFHIQCPGCGITRALAALLHGNLREAFSLNALAVLALPAGILYTGGQHFFRMRAPRAQTSRALLYGVYAVLFAFTVARNL